MIGSELYDHTALVLNKYRDELRAEFPMRQPEMEAHWGELTADNRAVIRENRAPRGEPRPIVELIWDGRPDAFSLAKELKSGMKLCQTSVGKVYRKLLEKELDGMKHGVGEVSRVRRDALKKELKKWKKCKDTYSDLLS